MAATTTQSAVLPPRSSARVRRQPELFTSSPFSSSNNNKRKRNDQDAEDADADVADDLESDPDVDDVEDDADEEELRERARKARKSRTPAPKKSRTNAAKSGDVSLPIRNAASGKKKTTRGKAIGAMAVAPTSGLYADIFAKGEKLEDVVASLLKRFNSHESRAMAEIIRFFLNCTGFDAEVTEHDIEDVDGVTNKLEDLRDEYQATDPVDYPLVTKGKAATAFKHDISGFMEVLIKSISANGSLYNNPSIIENLEVWLSTMCSAPNRSWRHTASVLALSAVTALCEIANEVAEEAAKHQRHADTERSKARVNKTRVKDLQLKAKDMRERQEYVEARCKDWFDTIFIHRYRDVDPLIRRDCVAALGDWIMTDRDLFFDSSHLRYMGWMLSDTNPHVRSEVLKQLTRMYKDETMQNGLKTFTEKFRGRMVEIGTVDAETSVRTAGIDVLDLLREAGLLEPDDIDAVGRLIFDNDAKVRKHVAGFFAAIVSDLCDSKIDELGGAAVIEEALPEITQVEAPQVDWLKFKSLAETLRSYDVDVGSLTYIERVRHSGSLELHFASGESRFTLAADALYDKIKVMEEWQVLGGYLLFDHSTGRANGVASDVLSEFKHESILSGEEESILLDVLHASVKRKLSDQAEALSGHKSKLKLKEKENLEEEHEEAAQHLAGLIPRLLRKYGDVPSTAAAVLRIENVLNLPSLECLRQDSATYAALLDHVRKQFMSHATDEVLEPASKAILHAKSYGELDDLTEEKVTALWEDVVNNLSELLSSATVSVRGASSSEELVALSNNLLRIIRLAAVSDCVSPLDESGPKAIADSDDPYQSAIDHIIALVKRAVLVSGSELDPEKAKLEDEIAARAAEASLFYLRWQLKSITAQVSASNATDIAIEWLEALANRRDTYADNLKSVLMNRSAGEDVCGHIAGCILELYSNSTILRQLKPKPGMSDDYIVLVMDIDRDLQKLIMSNYAALEKQFAKLSGRKVEVDESEAEADINADPVDIDPISDDENEASADTQQAAHASQQRKDAHAVATLLAEQKLCALVGKMVVALAAGVMDDAAAARKRLERNKTRLGPNFKECVAYLDVEKVQKSGKGRTKAKGKTANAKTAKSHAIVAEDEVEDEIEDEDEDAAVQRAMVADMEFARERDEPEAVDGAPREEEGVGGD